MPRRALLPLVLRAALLAGLIALLLAGLRQPHEGPRATRLTGADTDHDRLASSLVDPLGPNAILRDAAHDPPEHELQALAAAAERAPLFVELPGEAPGLRATAPDRPLVDRFSAIRFRATAAPSDTIMVRLLDRAGTVLDSVRVAADTAGSARGAFRVRPGRAGWTEWRVAVGGGAVERGAVEDGAVEGTGAVADGAVAPVAAWVAEADAPRVLVVAGPPTWETRYAVRALERSGAEVSLVQMLGRDNVITAGAAVEDWAGEGSVDRYDVVVLLPGLAVDPGAMDALEAWVAGGKGVLAASAAATPLALGSREGGGGTRERVVRGDSLVWTAPAELVPLPAADLEAAATVPSGVPPGGTAAARGAGGDPVLITAPLGGGRTAWLGLRESWRWVMVAGLESEHRAFWRSLVDWLAAPSADSLAVSVEPIEAAVGTTVDVGMREGSLGLQRPGDGIEPIAAAPGAERTRGRFVAVDTGVHVLHASGGADGTAAGTAGHSATDSIGGAASALAADPGAHPPLAGFRSRAPEAAPPAELGRARLSLLAASSGGAALEADSFAARVEAAGAAGDPPGWWLPWIFGALALVAVVEWTLRRFRGLR